MDLKETNTQNNNVDTTETTINCLSICSGIRGIERGIERVVPNLRTVCFVEIESFIIENLVAEMEVGLLAPAPIWSDIKTFDPEPFRGKIHLLTAGYSCQPFSNAGKRKGAEDPRHIYPYIAKAVDIIRPGICLFENVRGHVTLGLREVIASLEGMGYRVHWGIFSAEETGASHKRERVFIMAVRRELDYSSGNGQQQDNEVCTRRNRAELAGEMEHSTEQRFSESRQRGIRELQEENRERIYDRLEQSSKYVGLADSFSPGLEGLKKQPTWKELTSIERGCGQIGELAYPNIWRSQQWYDAGMGRLRQQVARPGEEQHPWEHPRVISREAEYEMGMPTHGYNIREDVLRALGNSVYPPTAELAWNTLLTKHKLTL